MTCHALSHFHIASVEIKTFHNATRLAGHTPVRTDEFSYSIAFTVAYIIVRGQVGVPEPEVFALKNPGILRISTAITLINNPYLAQVSIVMRDDSLHEAAPRTPRGDNDLPLSDAKISEKLHLFSDPILGSNTTLLIETFCPGFDHLDADGVQRLLDTILRKPE